MTPGKRHDCLGYIKIIYANFVVIFNNNCLFILERGIWNTAKGQEKGLLRSNLVNC